MDAGSAHDLAPIRLKDHSWYRLETVAGCVVRRGRLFGLAALKGVGAALLRGTA